MSATSADHLETAAGRAVHETIERLMKGIRDPESMRKAREEMDRGREEVRQRLGTIEVVVDLVREMRDR